MLLTCPFSCSLFFLLVHHLDWCKCLWRTAVNTDPVQTVFLPGTLIVLGMSTSVAAYHLMSSMGEYWQYSGNSKAFFASVLGGEWKACNILKDLRSWQFLFIVGICYYRISKDQIHQCAKFSTIKLVSRFVFLFRIYLQLIGKGLR